MSLPTGRQGWPIVKNLGGQDLTTLAELDARYSGGGAAITFATAAAGFDLTTLTQNTNVTIGQTGAGGTGTWSDLDAYPEDALVHINFVLDFDGDGVNTAYGYNLTTNTNYTLGSAEIATGTTTEFFTFGNNGFARMENGLITLNYSSIGDAVASLTFTLNSQFCIST